MRDSLSIMDRCIGISRDIDAEVVRNAAGLAQKDYLFALSSACINKNVQKALKIIDQLHSESKDMARLCAELIDHFRNYMLIKTVKNPRDMFIMNDEEFEEAQSQCDYVTLAEIVYFMDVLQRSAERMGKSSSNRTEIETALVKLTAPELDGSNEALVARIAKLEKAVNMGGFSKLPPNETVEEKTVNKKSSLEDFSNKTEDNLNSSPYNKKTEDMEQKSKNNTSPVSDKPVPFGSETSFPTQANNTEQKPVNQKQLDLETIYANAVPFDKWQEVVESLKEYSRTIGTSFMNTDAYISGDYLLIDAKTDIPFNLLKRNPKQKNQIRDAVMGITGKRYKLGPYRPPVKQKIQSDPLESFAKDLKSKGINVIEE